QAFEVVPRALVEILRDDRRIRDEFREVGILAVENTQRIAVEPAQTVGGETLLVGREVLDQDVAVSRPRFRRADRVQLERRMSYAERAPQPRRYEDQLGIDLGLLEAERLDAELMKLPVTPLLRLLAAKHRAAAPELLLAIV